MIPLWSLLSFLFVLGTAMAGADDPKEMSSIGQPAIPRNQNQPLVRRGYGSAGLFAGGYLGYKVAKDYYKSTKYYYNPYYPYGMMGGMPGYPPGMMGGMPKMFATLIERSKKLT
uniref:Uncharacterized protein n=1 Tax=Cacopsylla melanoneura TaxID=428564 RepID=A0A8D8YPD1_9HEMI